MSRQVTSAAYRVILFFAVNPMAFLTTAEISERFEIEPRYLSSKLNEAMKSGMLSRKSGGGNLHGHPEKGRPLNVYGAGPRLLRILQYECMYTPAEMRCGKEDAESDLMAYGGGHESARI